MDVTSCSYNYDFTYGRTVNMEVYIPCSYVKKLNQGIVNSTALRLSDCADTNCRGLMNSNAVTFKDKQECTFYDEQTKSNIHAVNISDVCGSVFATTATPRLTTITPTQTSGVNADSVPTPSPPVTTQANNSSGSTAIVGIVAACVVVVLIGVVIYVRRRKQSQKQSNSFVIMGEDIAHVKEDFFQSTSKPTFTSSKVNMGDLAMFKIQPSDLIVHKRITSGPSGEVWLGEHGDEPVALKRLPQNSSLSAVQQFADIICLHARIQSPSIVSFVGVMWNHPSDIVLVEEFMDGGDLRTALNSHVKFTWEQKLGCLHQVAEALGYLHFMDPKLIHRNVKSSNILLDASLALAKLSDFRLSRVVDDSTMTIGAGTFRWMAPEVLIDGHYSEAADIFSFGVVMAEINTGLLPYSDVRGTNGRPYSDAILSTKVMSGEIKPSFAPDCPKWFIDLGLKCLSFVPTDRPTALEISYRIRTELRAVETR